MKKESDEVTNFSAKGPISGLVKPGLHFDNYFKIFFYLDVAAPGENIVSTSGRTDAYVAKSGTSMR